MFCLRHQNTYFWKAKKKCNIEERKRGERVRREKETEEAEQNRGMEMR